MDKINIKNLEVFGNHGVYPEENKLGQKFLIDAILYTSTREASLSDDLTKSVNYGEVCEFISDYVKTHTYKLIETVAENLAVQLLLSIERITRVNIEVKKPWAPVGLPLKSVSVEIERGWHTAYISIGSNIGDRQSHIKKGIAGLNNMEGCKVIKQSSLNVTKPYGVTKQDDFINGCVKISTYLSPKELLEGIHQIEKEAGREKTYRWGPRTLDLDIIFYDDLIYHDDTLIIPHADMQNRDFVLKPLSELSPYIYHPILNKTVEQLLNDKK